MAKAHRSASDGGLAGGKKKGAKGAARPGGFLTRLGVFGFDPVEPVILAALVTEDPMLLIGNSGTGKTFLLNSLSEELGLEHRHYNASLISFDDLVGFPYPDEAKSSVRFLETPATVWGAQSVLIDEISRCKPEHQNRLFSLVHERRLQGIALPRLRFRWAAMNPCSADQGGEEEYAGSEPLDPALADRFAVFVTAGDWGSLTQEEREQVANPAGEGRIARDDGRLAAALAEWRKGFLAAVDDCPGSIVAYAVVATSALNTAGIRVSPRRSRLLARTLLAASIVAGGEKSTVFRRVLESSLPHACWGAAPSAEAVAAAHRAAWDSSRDAEKAWVHRFLAEGALVAKLAILAERCPTPDAGSQAIAQLIASESAERAAAFAFAVYPAAAAGRLPIGAEGVNDLGKVAGPILSVKGEVSWQERREATGTHHPDLARYAKVLGGLSAGRAERARQFFNWALVAKRTLESPEALESEIEACVAYLKARSEP